ncbi:MAG TPA: 5-(carboxyamino)imidazole ribonucleotide mutase [Firmicutes bacterium]|jgi:phosphoribosylaminoimidazole carboxylase PurE protein|nr:5-(carboxyamino)imidazole ribonucleotide mutase [Bacillota bacterium]
MERGQVEKPQVGIVLGSASDQALGEQVIEVLTDFDVSFELVVASAHRTPLKASSYANEAAGRGIKVLIAVAGLAAHLPGVLAAGTTLPVIGVPAAGGTLGGLDALLSIAQMPKGIPVATVGINNGRNAALLAVAILAAFDQELTQRLKAYRQELADKVEVGEQQVLQELKLQS